MNLRELGKHLNLNPSTISRALTRPDLVSEETRKRVISAVQEFGYVPNAVARSLKHGHTQTLGVIVSDIQNPFYSTVVRAVEQVAVQRGYSCVICNADEDAAAEERALNLLKELQVAGVIHASTGENIDALRRLRDNGMPVVDIDRHSGLDGVDSVLVDNEYGARLAAAHLHELGHTRIAIIAGPEHLTPGRDRLKGFLAGLASLGDPVPQEYVEIGDFREASGYEAASRLMTLPNPPTALFVSNNEMMAGALAALQELAVRVATDISIISFDDVRWAKYVHPPLTVIAQPTEQIGRLAATLLFERLGGRRESVHRLLEPQFIRRQSCGPPRTEKEKRPSLRAPAHESTLP